MSSRNNAPPLRVWAVAAAMGLAALAAVVPRIALADDDGPPAVSQTDREAFRTKLAEIQKLLTDLNSSIGQTSKEIDTLTDPKAARGRIDSLQAAVAAALGAVADNGEIATLGARVLAFERDKIKQLQGSNFAPDQKQTLLQGWQKLVDDTERATAELGRARTQIADLLKTIQERSDYIAELAQLDDGKRMLEVIRELSSNLRQTSNTLKDLVSAFLQPGS
jgi:septal ring factor EnvC (AmiA/AmiB activator)